MTYTPKPGDGTLFPNDRKSGDKSPDHTGFVLAHRDILKGEKLNLAGWTKHGSRGDFISLRLSDPRTKEGTPSQPKPPEQRGGGFRPAVDPEIPF